MDDRWRVLTVVTFARSVMGFQLQTVGSSAAELKLGLGLDNAELGFLIGLFLLPGLVVALPSGVIGRRFGDRRVVMAGLALMLAGGTIFGFADGYAQALAGRLIAGIGGVLLTVLLSKIVADRFVGREIVLAMAIMLNSFPIGIALGQFSFPYLSQHIGWWAVQGAAAAAALAAFILMATLYRDPAPGDVAAPATGQGLRALSFQELIPICGLGLTWASLNGALVTMTGFAPSMLREAGYSTGDSAILLALSTVLMVISVQSGGWLGQGRVPPRILSWLGSVFFGLGLLAVTVDGLEVAGIAAASLLGAIGAGALNALAGMHARPQNRAVGYGLFLTWLYAGFAFIPMAAGVVAQATGSMKVALAAAGLVCLAGALPALLVGRMRPVS